MPVATIPKVSVAAAVTLFLASACGGNSFSGDEPRGGASAGGSSATAGSSPSAGKSQGGGTASAGTASGGASGGATSGGSHPGGEACNAPPVSGECDGALQRWFHDTVTGLCRPFIYGGCGGNENNYQTFEDCQKACPGGSPNFDACSASTDCIVTGGGCCGICDGPSVTARDLVAINSKHLLELQQCAFLAAPPGDVPACAPCPGIAPDAGNLRYFVADCIQNQCVVKDIRTSSVSACKTDGDCRVRNGNDCCENCSVSEPIAVNVDGSLEKLVCGTIHPGCPECAPPPSGAIAVCGNTGHCQLAYPAVDNR